MLSQNEIIIDQLRQYINKNARFEVIGRAFGYYPSLISNNANKLLFECSGSQIDPYDVFLDLHNYYNIKSSCSCPYNGAGICKHQVASLNKLDRKSTGLNSSHVRISYAVFCLKKKKEKI